ncbi:MAG: hypothetical protein C4306_06705 [Thermoleophilia bacterium]
MASCARPSSAETRTVRARREPAGSLWSRSPPPSKAWASASARALVRRTTKELGTSWTRSPASPATARGTVVAQEASSKTSSAALARSRRTRSICPVSSFCPRAALVALTAAVTTVAMASFAAYAHLSRIVVHPGQRVRAGDLLGYSGAANGVPQLHLAAKVGSPTALLP